MDHLLGVLLDEWAVRERNWRARVTAAFHAHSETERALPEDDMANTAGSSGGGDDALEAVEDGSGAEGDGSGHMVLYRASFAPAVQQLAPALTDKQATALFVSAERFTLERQWKKLNLPRGYLPVRVRCVGAAPGIPP